MDQATITEWTRRGIREPSPVDVSDSLIESMTLQGVFALGLKIKDSDPSYYNTRVSVSSRTHVFAKPSDSLEILRVWDLLTTAGTITAASNASPIVITEATHGRTTGNIVVIHDVGGNTAANGTFAITKVNDNTYSLDGSTGNATYTSGGKVYQDPRNPPKITKKLLKDATLSDRRGWYPRGSNIVVDDKNFTDDILVDYIASPSAITNIPEEYHLGLVAFNVINLIRIPDSKDRDSRKDYEDKVASRSTQEGIFKMILASIDQTFDVSAEPEEISMGIDFDDYL